MTIQKKRNEQQTLDCDCYFVFARSWEGGLVTALRGVSRYLEMQIYPQELKYSMEERGQGHLHQPRAALVLSSNGPPLDGQRAFLDDKC